MGFRLNIEECHGQSESNITYFGAPDCCCDKNGSKSDSNDNPCSAITCILQGTIQSENRINTVTTEFSENLKAVTISRAFVQVIRPALQEKTPYYILPPPHSGRFLGILHRKLII